jgi:hypothetical protein
MAGDRRSPVSEARMNQTDSATSTPVAGILGLVGGALMALGSFLAWAEVAGGGTSVIAKGVDGSDGYITLVAGIVGGGIGLYDALTAKDSVLDAAAEELAPSFEASAQEVRTVLDQAIDAGQLSVSIGIGLYVVIGGGVVALAGGILGLRGSGESAVPGQGATPATPATTIAGSDAPPAPMPPATPPLDPGA